MKSIAITYAAGGGSESLLDDESSSGACGADSQSHRAGGNTNISTNATEGNVRPLELTIQVDVNNEHGALGRVVRMDSSIGHRSTLEGRNSQESESGGHSTSLHREMKYSRDHTGEESKYELRTYRADVAGGTSNSEADAQQRQEQTEHGKVGWGRLIDEK